MAAIGDLAVRVGADVSNFESGIASAARTFKQFSSDAVKRMRKVINHTAKMGAAATAAGAAMTAALYVKQSKVIDSLAKTADALGVTTEALQAMNHLAELNGVSAESMSKGLRRMEVNLGMAARQGGNAKKALDDIGISIHDVIKMRPDDQLQALASAISNVSNQSLKASIATDLFGRDGVAMLKVLNQVQKDGIQPTIKMLEEYGIAISRIDAAQVEAANDSFFEAQRILEGLGNTLTVELAPYVQEIADRFKALAKESGGFGDEMSSGIRTAIRFGAKLADVLHGLKVVFKGVELVGTGFSAAVISAFELVMKGISVFADSAINKINMIITGMNKLPGVSIGLIDTVSDSAFMNGIHSMGDAARDSVTRVRSELQEMARVPLPSDAVNDFLDSVREKSIETAEAVAASVQAAMNPEGGEGGTQEEIYARKEQALRDHLNVMYGIQLDHSKGMEGLINKQWGMAEATTFGAMRSIVSTMGQSNKKAFEMNKKFAIADAIISTAQGIAAGVKLGWPMAIPAVAWAAAQGFAQISAIKRQSFSGGGGGGASTAAAGGGQSQAATPSRASGGQSAGTLTVAPIDPDAIFSGSAMQSFGERIHEFSKDGGKVVFEA